MSKYFISYVNLVIRRMACFPHYRKNIHAITFFKTECTPPSYYPTNMIVKISLGSAEFGPNETVEYDTTETTRIQLVHCKLSTIPSELMLFTKLQSLVLCNGTFTTVPPEIGDLINLKYIMLCGDLIAIPPEIGKLTALQILQLFGNELTALPPEIGNLVLLERLTVHNNRLTTLPREIGNLTNLHELNVSRNPLTSLPLEIGYLTKLGRFWLHECPFVYGNTTHLTSIQVVSLFQRCLFLRNYFALALNCSYPVVHAIIHNTT